MARCRGEQVVSVRQRYEGLAWFLAMLVAFPFSDSNNGVDRMIHSLAFEADTEFDDIEILESTSTDGKFVTLHSCA